MTVPIRAPEMPHQPICDRLKDATRALHTKAERSGIIRDLVRKQANLASYTLFLRNLLPAYAALESGLMRHCEQPGFAALAAREVFRTSALEGDLQRLCGRDWATRLPVLPEGERYAQAVADSAAGRGHRLMAHAYVRYLGDLNGGRVLGKCVQRGLGIAESALAFYSFPGIDDLEAFAAGYRAALDRACLDLSERDEIVREAAEAFVHNIAVSEAASRQASQVSNGV